MTRWAASPCRPPQAPWRRTIFACGKDIKLKFTGSEDRQERKHPKISHCTVWCFQAKSSFELQEGQIQELQLQCRTQGQAWSQAACQLAYPGHLAPFPLISSNNTRYKYKGHGSPAKASSCIDQKTVASGFIRQWSCLQFTSCPYLYKFYSQKSCSYCLWRQKNPFCKWPVFIENDAHRQVDAYAENSFGIGWLGPKLYSILI